MATYSLELNSKTSIFINRFHFAALSNFTINQNKKLQAIKIIDVYKGLINKINNSAYRIQINTEVLEEKINNVAGNKYVLLTNGSGLRGYPIELVEEARRVLSIIGIKLTGEYEFTPAKFITTLSNFLEFIYIVFGLKFDVTYNIETDTYTVGFTTFEQSLNSNVIARLTNVNKVNFEPATEFSYTNIKAGYTPKEDSLFGKSEYNNTMEFNTMYDNIDENILNLVSPYSGSVLILKRLFITIIKNSKIVKIEILKIILLFANKNKRFNKMYFN